MLASAALVTPELAAADPTSFWTQVDVRAVELSGSGPFSVPVSASARTGDLAILTLHGDRPNNLSTAESNWLQPFLWSFPSYVGVWYAEVDANDPGSSHLWSFAAGPTRGLTGHIIIIRPAVNGTLSMAQLDAAIFEGENSTSFGSGAVDGLMFLTGVHEWNKSGAQTSWPMLDLVPPAGYTGVSLAADVHVTHSELIDAYHHEDWYKVIPANQTEPATQFAATESGGPGGGAYTARAWQGFIQWTEDPNAPPAQFYVAMGDSFQAGVGAGDYFPETDTDTPAPNHCKQSPHAYAPMLVDTGVVPHTLDFVACGGATISDMTDGSVRTDEAPFDEGAQIDHLSEETALVTIGVGGNDLGFSEVFLNCISSFANLFFSCESTYDDDVSNALLGLLTADPLSHLNQLQDFYTEVALRAPNARILVLGYPRFFPPTGAPAVPGAACPGIRRVSDQLWINYKTLQLDRALRASAESVGAEYVDLYGAFDGHELCNPNLNEEFLNGIAVTNLGDSFHPKASGYGVIADHISQALAVPAPGEVFTVFPGETVSTSYTVSGGTAIGFSTSWPGSDVEMRLTAPSGRVIHRSTSAEDVFHQLGNTRELYYITDPEGGEWTIQLYGNDVSSQGEETRLVISELPVQNQDPTAHIGVTQSGRFVTVDASMSSDPDGGIVDYLWEFGDGAVVHGSHVTHAYEGPGSYLITLVVTDGEGGMGFATADHEIATPDFDFGGLLSPVNAEPIVNTKNAGRAVPIRFSLGGDFGLSIFDPGYPAVHSVDCVTGVPTDEIEETVTAGNSSLTYDSANDEYTYVWMTENGWAGTCRRLVLALSDGTRETATFEFR